MKNPNTRKKANAEALNLDNQSLAHINGTATQNTPNNGFKLIGIKEILTPPPPLEWLIEDYMLRGTQAQLIGESTIGKTYFSVAMALSIATGRPFMDKKVKQGATVYINAEGHTGIRWRIKGWEQEFGSLAGAPIYLSNQSADFLNEANIKSVQDEIDLIAKNHDGKLECIFVDTFHRNMHGDENSSQDIGLFMENLERLCKRYDAAGFTNHHPGHNSGDRGRGSSCQRASLDTEFLLKKQNGHKALIHKKLKDGGPEQPSIGYSLKQVTIPWVDVKGNKLTTCVPEFFPLTGINKITKKLKPVPENLGLAIESLVNAMDGSDTTTKREWKTIFSNAHGGKPGTVTKGFNRAIGELTEHGVVTEVDTGIYCIGDYSDCPWSDIGDYLPETANNSSEKDKDTKEAPKGQVSYLKFRT